VNKLLLAVNSSLILIILGLGYLNANTWFNPKYPSRINGEDLQETPIPPTGIPQARKPYAQSAVATVTRENLFRKERTPFQPAPAVAKLPESATNSSPVPPPDLKLKGVILMPGKRIALLEGTYSVLNSGNVVKSKTLKHQGYALGSRIGAYKITRIEKNEITLDDTQGQVLNLKLAEFPPGQLVPKQKVSPTRTQSKTVKKAAATRSVPGAKAKNAKGNTGKKIPGKK